MLKLFERKQSRIKAEDGNEKMSNNGNENNTLLGNYWAIRLLQ